MDERISSGDGATPRRSIAPWVQIPRLEAILGVPLADVSWDVLEQLVDRRVPEDMTLEYKGAVYGKNDGAKQELCKDVVAFANAGGGLIVIGIAEDEQGNAAALVPVMDLESEARRCNEVLISGLAPWVRDLAVWECKASGEDGTGALLIVVPQSDEAPHAVRRGDAYVWPVRQDRITRFMSEPELASRYRDRFRADDEADERVREVSLDGLAKLDRSGVCWLALSLVPTRAGKIPAERNAYRDWLTKAAMGLPVGLSTQTAVLGRRRVIFTDQFIFRGTSRDHHLELHEDGSGFAAIVVSERREIVDRQRLDLPEHLAFDVDSVVQWTVAYLRILAAHAVNASAGGDLVIRALLVAGVARPAESDLTPAALPLVPSEPFTTSSGAYFGQRIVPGSMPVFEPEPLDLVATPSIATSARDLISVAHDITRALFSDFASTPTDEVLTEDGTVLKRSPDGVLAPLVGWARHQGVLVED